MIKIETWKVHETVFKKSDSKGKDYWLESSVRPGGCIWIPIAYWLTNTVPKPDL